MLKITKTANILRLEIRNNNSEIVKYGISNSDEKFTKKLVKLSKSKKLAKSKKIFKNENLSKFNTKKAKSIFLIFDIKMIFNYL